MSNIGVIGACEDQDEYETRNQLETNFMGTLNIIQLSLPYFRGRGAGRYLIFSSTSGALGVPGLGRKLILHLHRISVRTNAERSCNTYFHGMLAEEWHWI